MRQAFGLDTDPGEALTRRARAGCERSPPPLNNSNNNPHTHAHAHPDVPAAAVHAR